MDIVDRQLDRGLIDEFARQGLGLEAEIGHGGMASVYRAYDRKHERQVAVKILQHQSGPSAGRLLREIQLAAPLAHPHIVPVYDSGQIGGVPYLVMPLVEGETLRDRLEREGALPVGEAVQIARDVGDALGYAHARGVIHRDIKPENILLQDGHALVTDFGIALGARTGEGNGRRLTEAGVAVGTAEYMSPEQASGEPTLDARSDLYSLGCVLYEMLTGEPPFLGRSARETMARRFREPPPSIHRADVGPALQRVVATALALDPAKRFATATQFVRALSGERLPARRPRLGLRPRWLALAAGLATVIVLWWAHRPPPLDPHRVVVGRFSNETGVDSMNYLGVVAAERIRGAVADSGAAIVATSAVILPSQVDPGLVRDTLDDPQRVRTLGAETGSGLVVSGSYYRIGNRISFLCEITDINQGRMVRAIGPIEAPFGTPERAVDSLRVAVASALKRLLRPREPHAGLAPNGTETNGPP